MVAGRERLRNFALGLTILLLIALTAVGFWHLQRAKQTGAAAEPLRVLAYASFVASWGPGPELAQLFESITRRKVELVQADDATILLGKLAAFPSDVVIGFDQFSMRQAARARTWRALEAEAAAGAFGSTAEFLAIDWAPMGFVYRQGEIEPPRSLDDLKDPRFRGAIALQDPRSSSPGFQFLAWVVAEKGEAAGFAFFNDLQSNVQSVSGSWSQSYGVFSRGLAKLVFSYATSVLYHRLNDGDQRYRFAALEPGGLTGASPLQVEYVAIPDDCRECELAQDFVRFLLSPDAQQILMRKNWMLPVLESAAKGTEFEAFERSLPQRWRTMLKRPPVPSDEEQERWLRRWGKDVR